MTLTRQQKALVENIIMVVEELTVKWNYHRDRYQLNDIILYAIMRVQTMLRQESLSRYSTTYEASVAAVAEVIGKEVRRARSYKDMAAEDIIEALDVAYKILKVDD